MPKLPLRIPFILGLVGNGKGVTRYICKSTLVEPTGRVDYVVKTQEEDDTCAMLSIII